MSRCQVCLADHYEKLIAQIQADVAESEKCSKMMLAKIDQLEKRAEFNEKALQYAKEVIADLEDVVDELSKNSYG